MVHIEKLIDVAIKAGQIALKYYNSDYFVKTKQDDTPVTKADIEVNNFICSSLQKLYPNIPILSEENPDKQETQLKQAKTGLFIIDPIDGTEAFIEKRPEFSINIGYVTNNEFSVGVVYVPRLDILYFNDIQTSYKITNAHSNPDKTTLPQIKESNANSPKTILLTHRKQEKSVIEKELLNTNIQIKELLDLSSSYKFCLVAEGKADFYMRRANMKIWDIAASMPILNKLNYQMFDMEKDIVTFNKLKNSITIPWFNVGGEKDIELLY